MQTLYSLGQRNNKPTLSQQSPIIVREVSHLRVKGSTAESGAVKGNLETCSVDSEAG